MIKVYIAGPYTKGDVALNVKNALRLADYLTHKEGIVPYVPHLTHFWHMMYPQPYQFWLDYDMIWLKECDALVRIAGESSGADKEVEAAKELGMPCHVFRGFDLESLSSLDAFISPTLDRG